MKKLAGLASALSASLSLFAPRTMGAEELPKPGQVEVRRHKVEGTDTPKFVVRTVMALAPKQVWAVISDCAHYKDRLPHVAASELVKGWQHSYLQGDDQASVPAVEPHRNDRSPPRRGQTLDETHVDARLR